MNGKDEKNIIKAIDKIKSYGVSALDNQYLLATDVDGDLRIAPMGLMDKILWKAGAANANNFVKVKDLIE